MLNKNQNTKEQILEIAEDLIMNRGFNAFSYKDISTRLNVKNAAIHYHYPSKTDLGIAVLQNLTSRFRALQRLVVDDELSPLDSINGYFETYIQYLDSKRYVCMGGSLETDFQTFSESMQKEVKNYTTELIRWMETILRIGKEKGQFQFDGTSHDKAIFVLSTLKGALQTARASEEAAFFKVMDTVKEGLGM